MKVMKEFKEFAIKGNAKEIIVLKKMKKRNDYGVNGPH